MVSSVLGAKSYHMGLEPKRINYSTRDSDPRLFPRTNAVFCNNVAAAAAGDADRYGMQTWDAGRVQQFTQRLERHVCVAVNSVRARLLFARNKVFRSAEERKRTGAQQQRQQQVICRRETRLDGFFFYF